MSKCILVLDKLDYKAKETEIAEIMRKKYDESLIIYTAYEDALIRKLRKIPYIGSFFQHILYWLKSFRYAKRIMREANSAKVICINPIVAVFLGLLNGKKNADITMCGFLFVPKTNGTYYEARKKVMLRSMEGLRSIVVYSQKEMDYYHSIFGDNGKFRYVPYGIDYDQNKKYAGAKPDRYIFSGGGSNRDYKTLVEAYRIYAKSGFVPLCIATLPQFLEGIDTTGIDVRTDVTLETIGDWMRNSALLIISLKDVELSAGHQVLLQGLKENVPVLINKIPSILDYVSNEQVEFFESGNTQELADKMKTMLENPQKVQNAAFYEEHYTFNKFLERLLP